MKYYIKYNIKYCFLMKYYTTYYIKYDFLPKKMPLPPKWPLPGELLFFLKTRKPTTLGPISPYSRDLGGGPQLISSAIP